MAEKEKAPYRGQENTVLDEAPIVQLIIFKLGKEEYGVNIDQVRDIVRTGVITPIPDSPDFIRGVTNVRGEIAVVIDPRERFFLSTKKVNGERHIVMTVQEKNLLGLIVDEVTEVMRIPETEISPTPDLVTRIEKTYVSGMVTTDNRLITLLDLNKVLLQEDLAKLAKLARREVQGEEEESGATEENPVMQAAHAKRIQEDVVPKEIKETTQNPAVEVNQ